MRSKENPLQSLRGWVPRKIWCAVEGSTVFAEAFEHAPLGFEISMAGDKCFK